MLKFAMPGKSVNLIAKREIQTSNFLPYLCHYNNSTILTKSLDMISIMKVDGFAFETADDDDVDAKKIMRNNVLIWFRNKLFLHFVKENTIFFLSNKIKSMYIMYAVVSLTLYHLICAIQYFKFFVFKDQDYLHGS